MFEAAKIELQANKTRPDISSGGFWEREISNANVRNL